jgi:ubiquitin C-terminal hydrolase
MSNMSNFSYPVTSTVSQNFSRSRDPSTSMKRTSSRQANISSTTGSNIVKTGGFDPRPELSKSNLYNSLNTRSSNMDYIRSNRVELQSSPILESSKSLIGLHNIGNTCYMNAVLQCITRLPHIKQIIKQLEPITPNKFSRIKGKLIESFINIARDLNSTGRTSSIFPSGLKSAIGIVSSQFLGYQQHDCAEFFHKLLEGLIEDTNRVQDKPLYQEMSGNGKEKLNNIAERWWNYSLSRENSFINDIFQGQYVSTIICSCKHTEISCDTFLDITLNLPNSYSRSVSINSCIDSITQENYINEYKCCSCKATGECKSKLDFYKCPKVLVLHLKRFVVNYGRSEKLTTEISFPDPLSIKKHDQTIATYKLHGICHHIGSLNYGHYYAECLEESKWYSLDDEKVSPIAEPQRRSTTAYLLFYVTDNKYN